MFEFPPSARRSLAQLARWWIAGAVVGGVVAVANAAVHSRVNDVLATQAGARAMDQVRLGILSRLGPDDFQEPHTPDKLQDIQLRLDPVLRRLSSDNSGLTGVDLIATNSVVIYSDQPGQAGRLASRREGRALEDALNGRVSAIPDTKESGEFLGSFDVYVPVVMDGVVVGAYEMDISTPGLRWSQPIALILVGGAAGVLASLLRRARARRRATQILAPLSPMIPSGLGTRFLTPRELEVLGLLADGHTYRTVARELIISEETVRSHVKRILRKTGQANRTAAVTAALRAGLITISSPITRQGESHINGITRTGVAYKIPRP